MTDPFYTHTLMSTVGVDGLGSSFFLKCLPGVLLKASETVHRRVSSLRIINLQIRLPPPLSVHSPAICSSVYTDALWSIDFVANTVLSVEVWQKRNEVQTRHMHAGRALLLWEPLSAPLMQEIDSMQKIIPLNN